MTTQSEALRLADALMETHPYPLDIKQAAAELRRLHAENECIRSALNGWIKENSPGGWIDDLRTQRDALLEALKEITPSMPPADAPCHYGIVPQEKCGHCGRIAKARAAIKAVEGEKT